MASETIVRTVLRNGLQVKLKPQPHQRTVNLGMYIVHGAKDESPEINGIAHYIEHVLFNPAHLPRPTKKLLQHLLEVGALYEAYTSKEYTRFIIACLPEHLNKAIQLLYELGSNQRIQSKAVEHERPIILHEHGMHFSSTAMLGELLDHAFWGDRSLGLFVIGRKENIQRFTKEDLEQRLKRFYVPDKTHLVAVGPIEMEPFVQMSTEHFGQWTSPRRSLPDPILEVEPSISCLPTAQSRIDILVGYLAVPFGSSDRYAVELLADILGGGMSSRLFLELREKRKMAYLVHAYAFSYALDGYLAIKVNCDKADLPKVYTAIQETLERIKNDGVREDELARAKSTRTTAVLRVLENSSQHLQLIGRYAVLNEDFFVDLEVLHIESVHVDQVNRIAQEIFISDRLAMVALGPKEDELLHLI